MPDWMFEFLLDDPAVLLSFGLLGGAAALEILFNLILRMRVPFHQDYKTSPEDSMPPVSVIISARNEEERLRRLIPELMSQEYPHFELIVVNDSSWDETKDILDAFTHNYRNLHVIHLDEDKQRLTGKKVAITLAMKAAKYEHVLLTDADCWPHSSHWIASMVKGFAGGKSIVLGYSPYAKEKGLLNFLIRYDAAMAAFNYLNFAKSGIPYMGVGRNMAYQKALFFEKGGFRKHMHLLSGDDDLFVNQNATCKNTGIILSPDSHMISEPKRTWREWFRQKERHFTTPGHYRFGHRVLLGLPPFLLLVFYSGWTMGLITGIPSEILWGVVGCRYFVLMVTLAANAPKLRGAWHLLTTPIVEPFHLLISSILYLKSGTGERNTWN